MAISWSVAPTKLPYLWRVRLAEKGSLVSDDRFVVGNLPAAMRKAKRKAHRMADRAERQRQIAARGTVE